uniref:Uncharacterized protein n=1 Tax=Anguilla anguilla TaxID=7936 RepID=A0A0E9V4Q1_ANGAN
MDWDQYSYSFTQPESSYIHLKQITHRQLLHSFKTDLTKETLTFI